MRRHRCSDRGVIDHGDARRRRSAECHRRCAREAGACDRDRGAPIEPLFGATELTVGAPALIMTVTLAGADENGPAPVELSVALTVKLKVPAAVGAPLSVPLLCSVVPAGKASEASARQLNPKEAEALI